MTQEPELTTPSETLARRVRDLRRRRGWSAQDLAERCEAAGVPELTRSLIANIETGRRRGVTLEEAMTLAYVLDVAPVHLFVPVEEQWFLVAPTCVVGAGLAREWVRGHQPLPGQDQQSYRAEVPDEERDPEQERRARYARWHAEEARGAHIVTVYDPAVAAMARGEERGFVGIVSAEELAEYRRHYPQQEQHQEDN
jgi:transcriptional regulator with XRE-family HTH domain